MTDDVQISGEPMNVPTMCRFTVDRPLYPDQSFHFGSSEAAEMSPLARRLFAIEGVAGVLITDNRVTVTKHGPTSWPEVGKQIGVEIREHLAAGDFAVDPARLASRPDHLEQKQKKLLYIKQRPCRGTHFLHHVVDICWR